MSAANKRIKLARRSADGLTSGRRARSLSAVRWASSLTAVRYRLRLVSWAPEGDDLALHTSPSSDGTARRDDRVASDAVVMTDPVITVDVRSELGGLRTVVMRLASPDRTSVTAVTSLLHSSVRAQFRHNMWKRYDYRRVRDQQERLAQVLRDHGVTVLFLDGGAEVNTQHYTRDIAFGIDHALFVARMGTRYREPEQQAVEPLLGTLSDVVRLPKGRIEGGDVMLFDNTVLVGLSEATDADGVAAMRETLALRGSTRAVVPVPFAHRGVIHLDTKFNIVDTHLAIISRRSLLPETIRWFEQHFELIDATDDETRAIEINTFVIGGGKVIMSERSERLAALLEQRGLTPILVDYSEVTRQPGSFRCTTLPIAREP